MSQVTLEGSHVLKSTFLGPGQRITVERTKYIDNMIRRGYVNLIAEHEPIRESDTSNVKEDSSNADTFGVPPESATKAVWLEFLNERGVSYPADATKAELLEAWNGRNAEPVD